MRSVVKRIGGRGYTITDRQVLEMLDWYDNEYPSNGYCEPPAQKGWLDNAGYKHAIDHAGRLYPPKLILHKLTGVPLQGAGLKGGRSTNSVFEELGFRIVGKMEA